MKSWAHQFICISCQSLAKHKPYPSSTVLCSIATRNLSSHSSFGAHSSLLPHASPTFSPTWSLQLPCQYLAKCKPTLLSTFLNPFSCQPPVLPLFIQSFLIAKHNLKRHGSFGLHVGLLPGVRLTFLSQPVALLLAAWFIWRLHQFLIKRQSYPPTTVFAMCNPEPMAPPTLTLVSCLAQDLPSSHHPFRSGLGQSQNAGFLWNPCRSHAKC